MWIVSDWMPIKIEGTFFTHGAKKRACDAVLGNFRHFLCSEVALVTFSSKLNILETKSKKNLIKKILIKIKDFQEIQKN